MTKKTRSDAGHPKDVGERQRAAPLGRAPAKDPQSGTDASVSGPREVIEQAGRDIARGLVDTDKRGAPSDVPGPRQSTGAGADVPVGGGNRGSYSERRRAPTIDSAPPASEQNPTRRR